jgi:hypothetical protein
MAHWRSWPAHLVAFALWIIALAAFLIVFWRGNSAFDAYSAHFGSLTQDEFAAANETMDRLAAWTRGLLFYAIAPLEVVTLILAIRARLRGGGAGAVAIAVLVGVVGLALVALAVLAAAMPAARMVG